MALDDIYKEVILDHYKNPRNKRELPGAELQRHANNPLCGDEITVFAHVEDGSIAEVAFQGAGCSISQSSASMMTEAVAGADVDEAKALAADFRGMMAGDAEPDEDRFGDLVALKGVVQYPDPHQVRRARVGRPPGRARGRRERLRRSAPHDRLSR